MDAPKLLLDEHIWTHLAVVLREQGFDVLHVHEVGLGGEHDDEVVLAFASERQRAILTNNARDFVPLAKQYFEKNREHAGIIISNQLPRGELHRRLERLLKSISAKELRNTVRFLQDYK